MSGLLVGVGFLAVLALTAVFRWGMNSVTVYWAVLAISLAWAIARERTRQRRVDDPPSD